MIALLIPVAFGALLVTAYRRRKAELAATSTVAGGAAPSPLLVLAGFATSGQQPPPFVVQCALAEAEALGRPDIAQQVIARFVAPVVHATLSTIVPPAPAQDDASAPAAVDVAASSPPAAATAQQDTVTVSGLSSPIDGVDNDSWCEFVAALERESPTFATDRHVGKFRARRERLRELGVDQVDTPEQQVAALERDMIDAYRHAQDGGLVSEYIATTVAIDGKEHPITLSGLLGVIQCAGLEGAYEWLEKPEDRKRFPHTTKQFLATNGVF